MLANREVLVCVALGQKTFLKPYWHSLVLHPHPENETASALREHNNNSVGMKGGDAFGKRELIIDTTDNCTSLKPKATRHETMVKLPFK